MGSGVRPDQGGCPAERDQAFRCPSIRFDTDRGSTRPSARPIYARV